MYAAILAVCAAPPSHSEVALADLRMFPDRACTELCRSFWSDRLSHLNYLKNADSADVPEAIFREASFHFRAWDALRDAQDTAYHPDFRLERLASLRALLIVNHPRHHPDDYHNGVMPRPDLTHFVQIEFHKGRWHEGR